MRAPGPWRIAQRVDHPDAQAARDLAMADLEGGADALNLVFAGAVSARGFGLAVDDVPALDTALSGVMLSLIATRLDAGGRGLEAARLVKTLAAHRNEDLGSLDLDLGLDPIGTLAATGRLDATLPEIGAAVSALLSEFDGAGFTGRAMLADGRPYHEAGASEAAELAATLATAVAYLRMLEAGGHDLARARDAVAILLVADADEFLTIAKFRAMRRLWARVEAACGLDPKPLRLHAETAWRMMNRNDPFVNILRTGMAACSAGLGGADSVTVIPYTASLGLADAFARRVARNSQIVLIEESNLARVADPAAGAGGFEALTEELTTTAWAAFQAIEREGGIVASLQAGAIQARIGETRATRAKNVATRREPLTGASEFPFLAEKPVTVLDLPPSDVVAPAFALDGARGDHLRGPALLPPRRALRGPARRVRRPSRRDGAAPSGVPGQSRDGRRLQRPLDLRRQRLRGRRHRGGERRGFFGERRAGQGFRRIRRAHRLPLLVGRPLRHSRRRGGRGSEESGRDDRVPRGQARRSRGGAQSRGGRCLSARGR